ncbi:MAG: helix-turn-helix domain-containing protein [Candidatus Eisenbacteria bacterium]
MAKEILDVAAAARYLRITRATLYKLAKEKKVPGLKIGGQWRFSKERLDELFQDGFHPDRPKSTEPEPQKTKV